LECEWRVCVSSTDALVFYYVLLRLCHAMLVRLRVNEALNSHDDDDDDDDDMLMMMLTSLTHLT